MRHGKVRKCQIRMDMWEQQLQVSLLAKIVQNQVRHLLGQIYKIYVKIKMIKHISIYYDFLIFINKRNQIIIKNDLVLKSVWERSEGMSHLEL